MIKKVLSVLLLVGIITSVYAEEVKTKVTTGGASAADIVSYQGPKARIAVGSFEVKAAKAYGRIGEGIQDMLIDALFKTNRFIVLEKAAVADLQSEYALGESGWSSEAPAKGTFETADIILTGAITAFEPDYQKTGGGGVVIPIPLKIGGGLKVEKKEAYIAASIRLVDVRTRRVIKTGTVEGYSSKSSLGIIGGGLIGAVALGVGFENYKNTPMEKAVMIMLENAIKEIVNSVPAEYYRYTAEGKQVPASGEKKTLGIVGGLDKFSSGGSVICSEDFGKYNVGAVPDGWILNKTSVEVAEYEGKKWMRFLNSGTVQKKVKVSSDYSLEITFFVPDTATDVSFKYGDIPECKIKGSSLNVSGASAGTVNRDNIHTLAVSRKNGQVVFYLDGKRTYTTTQEGILSEDLVISTKGIDINQGQECIITDIKIAGYK
ncbi:MAG: CsgG/HfaB family protein [Candidatus Omnitrophica bacterium]|nr:CsgG/HfaB family protein [Candidatus Omnitrophota bacterium]MCM8777670.1 CsgG/HfaB family protein [Candidatus Omnitrophota bacterium]